MFVLAAHYHFSSLIQNMTVAPDGPAFGITYQVTSISKPISNSFGPAKNIIVPDAVGIKVMCLMMAQNPLVYAIVTMV